MQPVKISILSTLPLLLAGILGAAVFGCAKQNSQSVLGDSGTSDSGSETDSEIDSGTDGDSDAVDHRELVWVKQAGGGTSDSALDHSVLADGSSVVTGYFAEEAVFGQGEQAETVLVAADRIDIFVAKYDPLGELKWAKRAGGNMYNNGQGVAALEDGSAIVTGDFHAWAVFGPEEENETDLTAVGYSDIFLAKYNSDGTLCWVKSAGGESHDRGKRVALLGDGSIMVAGEYSEKATFGMDENNETALACHNGSKYEDIFVAKYSADGELIWVTGAGGERQDYVHRMALLDDGSTLVTGQYFGAAVFGQGEENETALADGEDWNLFIAKYFPDGRLGWAKGGGGEWIDAGLGITTWPDGSFVVTGSFEASAVFGRGEPNETILTGDDPLMRDKEMFLAKYDGMGNLVWAKRVGGVGGDIGMGVVAMSDGGMLVSGTFSYSAVFGQGEENETVFSSMHCSIFLARYESDGTFSWVTYAPGGA